MQPRTRLYDSIKNPILQEVDGILHDPVAFHPAPGTFDLHPNGRDLTIRRKFRGRKLPEPRFFLGLKNRHLRPAEALETLALMQAVPGRQGMAGQLRHTDSRRFAFPDKPQEANLTPFMNHQDVFERMMLLPSRCNVLLAPQYLSNVGLAVPSPLANEEGRRGRFCLELCK
jgi:hypothetical protein